MTTNAAHIAQVGWAVTVTSNESLMPKGSKIVNQVEDRDARTYGAGPDKIGVIIAPPGSAFTCGSIPFSSFPTQEVNGPSTISVHNAR